MQSTRCARLVLYPVGEGAALTKGHDGVAFTSLGDRLRVERKRLGLSQEEFAARCGIHRRTLVNYEGNRVQPPPEFFAAIASAGVDPEFVEVGIRSGQRNDFDSAKEKLLANLLAALGYADHEERVIAAFHRFTSAFDESISARRTPSELPSAKLFREEAAGLIAGSPVIAEQLAQAQEIDRELLAATIAAVEAALASKDAKIGPEKKGVLVTALYRNAKSSGRVDAKMAEDAITLAL